MKRRHFLRGACGACAVAAFSGLLPSRLLAVVGMGSRTVQETRLIMGTVTTVTVNTASRLRAEEGIGRAFEEMDRLIAVFDRRSASSALGALNGAGRLAGAPAELVEVIAQAEAYGRMTGHAFNPAVQPVVALYEDRFKRGLSVDRGDLAAALELARPGGIGLSGRDIRFERSGMGLTLDGIAKGRIADAAAAVLERHGLRDYLINAGGDIRVSGRNHQGLAWNVGIENPDKTGGVLETLRLSSGAVATSGGYERFFDQARRSHHLVDPATGQSPRTKSVTVTAKTAEEADALATCLFILPPRAGVTLAASRPGAACLIIDAEGRRTASPNWG